MKSIRRNAITHRDAIIIAIVAELAGVVAAFSGAEPTGELVPDIVLCFGLAALVTWLGASAPWWALVTAGGVVTAASLDSALVVTLAGLLATIGAYWIGYAKASRAVERAVITGVIVSVALRLEMDQFFLSSALVAGAVILLVAITGWTRRQRYVRKRVLWGVGGFALVMVLGGAGMGAGALQAKSSAQDGYNRLLDGLDALDAADMSAASQVLGEAAEQLRQAGDDLRGPLTQLARFVPVVAQNRDVASDLLVRAADAAAAASVTLAVVDIDSLTIVNGVIDVNALEILAQPLADLRATVVELSQVVHGADSPWLVGPFQDKLDEARDRVDKVNQQAIGTSAAAQYGPAMLGRDGPRKYLFAFTNPAEARGISGLMGNWSEITIDNGRIEVTASGRTSQLVSPLREQQFTLDMPEEFFERYGPYGAGTDERRTSPRWWSNATMPPDMPTAGNTMAQLYKAATGTTVDGVFVVDPAGIASLLSVTGDITVPGRDEPITAAGVEQLLMVDQYQLVENEREDLLEAVTQATVDRVLSTSLPEPQELLKKIGPGALEGHISVYATRPEEEAFLRVLGIDNALPDFAGPHGSADGIAVININASGNKIESFLQREIRYTPVYDKRTGDVTATLEITLTNDAPTSGYPDYVIGNIVGAPKGTNRMLLEVYSRLGTTAANIDGEEVQMEAQGELGWNVYSKFLDVPSGETRVVTLTLKGHVAPGGYELIVRPQALPRDDKLIVDAKTTGGDRIFDFDGTIERRSVLSSSGVDAWRG